MGNLLWWAIGGGVVGIAFNEILQANYRLFEAEGEGHRWRAEFEHSERLRHDAALAQMQRDARSADTLAAEKAQSDAAAAAAGDWSGMVM